MKNRITTLLFASAVLMFWEISAEAQSIYTPFAFNNFAGSPGGEGNVDGIGAAARFDFPTGLALDGAGNIYIADEFNDTIRKITHVGTNWVVTTLAGYPRIYGTNDGIGSTGLFSQPTGVAVDNAGNVYVADQSNFTIRRVTPAGVVTTLAGLGGSSGSKDGSNSVARFNRPLGIAVDAQTNVYVADSGNYTIRKITPIGTNWAVTTIAGTAGLTGNYDGTNGTTRFGILVYGPPSIAVDGAGNLYVADTGNSTVREISPVGTNWICRTLAGNGSIGTANGTNSGAQFYDPWALALDNAGNIYVGDGDNLVRKMTPSGTNWVVSTLAGNTAFGSEDGPSTNAEFYGIEGLGVDGAGNVYAADANNETIRFITPSGFVTTLAGTVSHGGTNDGVGSDARLAALFGVAMDTASNLYFTDQGDNLLRKITPDGTVSTLAGDGDVAGGEADGTNLLAEFRQPSCIAIDPGTNIYIADAGNYKIRKVSHIGTNWVVTTIAGNPGSNGSRDGTNKVAQFASFYGICLDSHTNLYVADTYNDTIRRVSPVGTNWVVTTLAGQVGSPGGADGTNKTAQFFYPYGLVVDAQTNIYVADWYNMAVRKVRPVGTNWVVTTIAGRLGVFGSADGTNSDARFLYPQAITMDPAGNLYVSDAGNATIRRLSPVGTNWVVTTLGGRARPGNSVGEAGAIDGIGSAARLNNPYGLTMGMDGNLYILDSGESRVVKGTPLFLFDTAASSLTSTNGMFHFRITGPPGSNAIMQLSSDLQNWANVQTYPIPPIGFTAALPVSNTNGFYRALLGP